MSFRIIKKAPRYFEHVYNNGSKSDDVSDFEAILESIAQTFSIQCKNGSNIPSTPVPVLDIIVIDETDASAEETFYNLEDLRTRLTELQYIPYISPTGIEEAPIDGSQYARKDGGWVVVTGGGSAPTLQEVLLVGDRPKKDVFSTYTFENEDRAVYLDINGGQDLTLEADVLDADSELRARINGGTSTDDATLIVGAGVAVIASYNGDIYTEGGTITLPTGSLVVLKQYDADNTWYLNIIPAQVIEYLKRDGSNANSDIDLGAFGLTAKKIGVKGANYPDLGIFSADDDTRRVVLGDEDGAYNGTTFIVNDDAQTIDANSPVFRHQGSQILTEATNKLKEVGSFSEVVVASTSVIVTLDNAQPDTNFIVMLTPTATEAIGCYVKQSENTTTTFEVRFPIMTGTVVFNYAIYHN